MRSSSVAGVDRPGATGGVIAEDDSHCLSVLPPLVGEVRRIRLLYERHAGPLQQAFAAPATPNFLSRSH
jgi:hypothetical protein